MPIRVQTPHGNVEFPDGTSQDEMTAALTTLDNAIPGGGDEGAAKAQAAAQERSTFLGQAKETGIRLLHGAMSNFGGGTAPQPVTVGDLRHPLDALQKITQPEMVGSMLGGGAEAAAGAVLPEVLPERATVGRALRFAGDFDVTHPLRSTIGALGDRLSEPSPARTADLMLNRPQTPAPPAAPAVTINAEPDVVDRYRASAGAPVGSDQAPQNPPLARFNEDVRSLLQRELARRMPVAATDEGVASLDRGIAANAKDAAQTRTIAQRMQDTMTAAEQRADAEQYRTGRQAQAQAESQQATARDAIAGSLSKLLDQAPNAADHLSDLDAAIAAEQRSGAATRAAAARSQQQGTTLEQRADLEQLRGKAQTQPGATQAPPKGAAQAASDADLVQAELARLRGRNPSLAPVTAPTGEGSVSLRDLPPISPVASHTQAPAAVRIGASPTVAMPQIPDLQGLVEELRTAHGSAETGRMLASDPAFAGMSPTERTNTIRLQSGGPAGQLPEAAQRTIDTALASMTPAEQKAYLLRAPNAAAYEYIRQILKLK